MQALVNVVAVVVSTYLYCSVRASTELPSVEPRKTHSAEKAQPLIKAALDKIKFKTPVMGRRSLQGSATKNMDPPSVDRHVVTYLYDVLKRQNIPVISEQQLSTSLNAAMTRYLRWMVRVAYQQLQNDLLREAFASKKHEILKRLRKIMSRNSRQLLRQPFMLPPTFSLSRREQDLVQNLDDKMRDRILSPVRPFVVSGLKTQLDQKHWPTHEATMQKLVNVLKKTTDDSRAHSGLAAPSDANVSGGNHRILWTELRGILDKMHQGHHFKRRGGAMKPFSTVLTKPTCKLQVNQWKLQLVWLSTPFVEIKDPVKSKRARDVASAVVSKHLASAPIFVSGLAWDIHRAYSPRCLSVQSHFPQLQASDVMAFLSGAFTGNADKSAPLMADLYSTTLDRAALWLSDAVLGSLYPEAKHFLNILVFFTGAEASTAASDTSQEQMLSLRRDGCLNGVPTPEHAGKTLSNKNIALLAFVKKNVRASWEQRLKEMKVLGMVRDLPLDQDNILSDSFGSILMESIQQLMCRAKKR